MTFDLYVHGRAARVTIVTPSGRTAGVLLDPECCLEEACWLAAVVDVGAWLNVHDGTGGSFPLVVAAGHKGASAKRAAKLREKERREWLTREGARQPRRKNRRGGFAANAGDLTSLCTAARASRLL